MAARDEIMNAAEELFGRVGFDAAATREISRVSGINQGLIYYYFGNKEALFDAILERHFNNLNRTLMEAMEPEGSLPERMGRLMEAYIEFLNSNSNFSRIVQREASGGARMENVFQHLSPILERGIGMIEQALPQTRKGEMAAPQLLLSFFGMIASYFSYGPMIGRLTNKDPFSRRNLNLRKEHLRRMLEIVIKAL